MKKVRFIRKDEARKYRIISAFGGQLQQNYIPEYPVIHALRAKSRLMSFYKVHL